MLEFADGRRLLFGGMKNGERDKPDGVIGLARETADALGQLTVQHLRLARLEIKADLRTMGLQAGLIAVLVALAIVGYGLTMAGLAVILGVARREAFPCSSLASCTWWRRVWEFSSPWSACAGCG